MILTSDSMTGVASPKNNVCPRASSMSSWDDLLSKAAISSSVRYVKMLCSNCFARKVRFVNESLGDVKQSKFKDFKNEN